jgi:hypothetical protein
VSYKLKYKIKKEEKAKKYVSWIATKTQKFNISPHTVYFLLQRKCPNANL